MNTTHINELLDAHDKVPTKGEAVKFKKSLGSKITLVAQREKTKLFFHNPEITTNLKTVDAALKGIVEEEKSFKMDLKRTITKEEYEVLGEEPSKFARRQVFMIPPDVFETDEHNYTSDDGFNNFSCNMCNFSSTSEQIMIVHMGKKRKEALTEDLMIGMKVLLTLII